MHGIIVSDEFKKLIPPLSKEERNQLRMNLISDGCRDALIVWEGKNILLDGHNRYEICGEEGIEFSIKYVDLDSEEDALDWMDANQLGRRNLKPDQISVLRGRRYNRIKNAHGGDRKSVEESSAHFGVLKTSEKLAKEYGVSKNTIKRDGQFAEAAEKLGIEEEIISGEIKASKADIVKLAKSLPEKAGADVVTEALEEIKKPVIAKTTRTDSLPSEFKEAIAQLKFEVEELNRKKWRYVSVDEAKNKINEVVKMIGEK